MKVIKLTRGKSCIVDDEDYANLSQWKWHCGSHGYAVRTEYFGIIDGKSKTKKVLMHRVIARTPEDMEVDHIDRDILNNRKSNIRNVSSSQNKMNRQHQTRGRSQYKGVYWHGQRNRWAVQIKANGTRIHVGLFDSEIDAAIAYNDAALEYFGEFAYINPIKVA